MMHNQSKVKKEQKYLGLTKPWFFAVFVLILTIAVYFIWGSIENRSAEPNLPQTQTPALTNMQLQPDKLPGKWQRTDGGYILELKNPTKEGLLDAAYFNPNPIHVGRSGWQQKDGLLKVMVELQDKNYPGSLYQLTYYADNDQLRGTYFQAMERVSYDVAFTRIP